VAGSLIPEGLGAVSPELQSVFHDTAQHFTAYFFIAFLPMVAMRLRRHALIASTFGLLLGLLLEVAQLFVPTRLFEWSDLIANTNGIAMGMLTGAGASALLWRTGVRMARAGVENRGIRGERHVSHEQ
jgi:VanZ family protein